MDNLNRNIKLLISKLSQNVYIATIMALVFGSMTLGLYLTNTIGLFGGLGIAALGYTIAVYLLYVKFKI